MFTREELIAELPGLAALKSPPLKVVRFSGEDFLAPECEESVWVCQGWKRDFANGLLFWVKAVQAQVWSGRESYFLPYVELSRCEPLSKAAFKRLVKEYGGAMRKPLPPFLSELNGYRWGLQMHADWNDVSAVTELAEVFVAFSWSTTA